MGNWQSSADRCKLTQRHWLKQSKMVELALHLNPPDVFGNNWKMLADKLGYSHLEIQNFELEKSPTVSLLCNYFQQYEASVKRIHRILIQMERFDAVQVIQEFNTDSVCLQRVSLRRNAEKSTISELTEKIASTDDKIVPDSVDNFVRYSNASSQTDDSIANRLNAEFAKKDSSSQTYNDDLYLEETFKVPLSDDKDPYNTSDFESASDYDSDDDDNDNSVLKKDDLDINIARDKKITKKESIKITDCNRTRRACKRKESAKSTKSEVLTSLSGTNSTVVKTHSRRGGSATIIINNEGQIVTIYTGKEKKCLHTI